MRFIVARMKLNLSDSVRLTLLMEYTHKNNKCIMTAIHGVQVQVRSIMS
jgi:hypothetical protein